ncbi:7687_t:CDS:2, partial [Ambispora leptoticha]
QYNYCGSTDAHCGTGCQPGKSFAGTCAKSGNQKRGRITWHRIDPDEQLINNMEGGNGNQKRGRTAWHRIDPDEQLIKNMEGGSGNQKRNINRETWHRIDPDGQLIKNMEGGSGNNGGSENNLEKRDRKTWHRTEEPSTGQSWCPDCAIADPLIRSTVNQYASSSNTAVVLIEAPVGSRSEWRQSSNHVYKRDPRINISRIPTLVRWKTNTRLVEDECANEDNLKKFVEGKL